MGRTAKAPATPKRKPWTVLVWIAGDNDLTDFGLADLDEMKQVGSNARVDFVAQYDAAGVAGARRFHLHKGTTLQADLVADIGPTNTGDPAVAIDFFTWGMKHYPSDRVACVFWNHGSGIDETDVYARVRGMKRDGKLPTDATGELRGQVRAIASSRLSRALFSTTIDAALESKAIAFDDTSCDFLDNMELSHVISTIVKTAKRPIDILGFDACLMNMIEVAYQVRGMALYLVGSEETEPGEGWPYELVGAASAKSPAPTPRKLASAIVSSYVASYANNPMEDRVTQSALDITKIEGVASAVDALASACIANLQSNDDFAVFTKAVNAALRFDMRDFADLGDLCKQLIARSSNDEVIDAAKHVLAKLTGKGGLVVKAAHKGNGVAGATGTAIYFPLAGDVTVAYDQLDFAKDTRWAELIAKYKSA